MPAASRAAREQVPMKDYRDLLDGKRMPAHVAIIMDGNGRWAEKRSLPRAEGHRKGAQAVERLMDAALSLGLKVVSLYAFSTENWSRPKIEIKALWRLLEEFFGTNLEKIKQKGIRIRHSGSLDHLPPATRAIIQRSVRETEGNRRVILNFCLNYGSRQEIIGAVNRWADGRKAGEKMTADKMVRFLDTAGLPDVDLLIRTSGESRVSNFLLWQIAYAELLFVKVLWPDFSPRHLYRAICEFQKRERRYGGL
jgi:undecaprenyl diphosphate synthase